MDLNRQHHTVFYGWWVVGASFLIALYAGGVIFFGFTAFFEPIANEFGWSYAQISLAASLRGLEIGLLAPLMGLLVDRWGPRRLIFGGAILIGVGLLLLSRTTSLGMFYGAFALIAIGISTCSSTVLMTAVANWFHRKVATASGIAISGYAVGGLVVPLITVLIDMFDWRTALVILGLGMWVIVLPLSFIVRHKPEQHGYQLDGEMMSAAVIDEGVPSPQITEVDRIKQALTSRPFWHIALPLMFQALGISAVLTHVMPYLSSVGMARSTSSLIASAAPIASIGGRLGFGWFGDRFDKRRVTATGFILTALGLLLFGNAATGGMWLLVPFLLLFGTGWGGNTTMRSALLREYFGRKRFGAVYGFVIGITMIGHMAGAPLAGWVFDKWGSYQGIWFVFAGLSIAAMIIALMAPPLDRTIQLADKPSN